MRPIQSGRLCLFFLLFCLMMEIGHARAQPALLQGAYLQLQQLVLPKHSPESQLEVLSQEEQLKQLKEDNAQIEQSIRGIQKEQASLNDQPVPLSLPKKGDTLARLIDQAQAELDQWHDKKALSESVSLELSRERVTWQQALKQLSEEGSAQAGQRELLEHRLHNLTLKMRFAESYQELAAEQILRLNERLQLLETRQRQENADQETEALPQPDNRQLQQRLSQARKDLIQLQNLMFEVKYQLPEVHRMDVFYQLMLKQKERLQVIPLEQGARQLQQVLRLKRYLLIEEKSSLIGQSGSAERRQAIDREQDQLEQQLQRVRELDLLETELAQRQKEMILLLEQRQLWTATAPALSPSGVLSLFNHISQQLSQLKNGMDSLVSHMGWDWLVLLPVFWLYRKLGKQASLWSAESGNPTDFNPSDWLKLLTILLLRPMVLLVPVFFLNPSADQWAGLFPLLLMSAGWLLLWDAFKPGGVVAFCSTATADVCPWSWSMILSSMAGVWITTCSLNWYDNPFENRIAQLSLLIGSVWQLMIVWRWRNDFVLNNWRGMMLKASWIILGSLSLLASCLGYISLSWLIFRDVQWLLVSAGLLCLLYILAEQGLKIRASRMAIRKAIQLKQDSEEQHTSHEALKSSREMVRVLEKQGRVILNLSFTLLALLVVVLLWQDFSPLLSPLSETQILSFSREQGGVTLALGPVFSFFTVLIFTGLIAANLPGLLVILMPTAAGMTPGNVYILKRLLVYTIWAFGITLSLGQIGLPWEKLQWVVLAISVGAGLGLQDMVANFVSGLVILIERPLRVGDTVTINNIHGTVRHISVRATVIEDFDRKELIVPNKTLTSGQLTNWSLSSDIVRVQLWYGVCHGCDNSLVFSLLLQAGQESQKVLSKPPPEVYFIEYTEHAERYELRVFVNHPDDRYPAKNQVNQRVKELFQEHGVEVAHWQHDLNIVQMPEAGIRKEDRSGG